MSKLRHVLTLAVVVACGIVVLFSVERNFQPIARMKPFWAHSEFAGSPNEPTLTAERRDDIRKAELSRRAVLPAGDPKRKYGLNYEAVLNGSGAQPHPRPAEPLSPTYCRLVEPAPKDATPTSGPHRVHYETLGLFETRSGFGFWRMLIYKNDRGIEVASPAIDRVELVSLLTDDQPSVYVLDEMATPPLARQAKRRPLDEFERLGLDAVRRGEELVWARESPTRMFGAIRAKSDCLHCHAHAQEGALLGAFTYYLKVPVDRLSTRKQAGEKQPFGEAFVPASE
jgi:hypothetical protein